MNKIRIRIESANVSYLRRNAMRWLPTSSQPPKRLQVIKRHPAKLSGSSTVDMYDYYHYSLRLNTKTKEPK